MRKRTLTEYSVYVCVVLSLISIILQTSLVCSAQAGTATVALSPPSITASVGQNFSVNVTVANVSDSYGVYGWEFTLNWTASLVDSVGVTEGPFLKAGGPTFFTYDNSVAGHLIVDCTLEGQISGVSGDGILATLTFNVKSAGQSSLDLYNAILVDGNLNNPTDIPCQVVGGYGYFSSSSSAHDVAVTDVQASPTTTLIGTPVKINVTTQDLGPYAETYNVSVYANSEVIGMRSVSLTAESSTMLLFTWDTSNFEKGDYMISASASVVQGETNTTNNDLQAVNPVTLLFNGHDVAVINVQASKTVVGQGYSALITATVKDYGVLTETFNTTIYISGKVAYFQSVSLDSGVSTIIAYTWNTTGFVYGNYTMSAYASPVPGENDTTNNSYVSNIPVHVGVPGDISSIKAGFYDGIVDMRDIAYIVSLFDTKPTSLNWNPNADVNSDGVVNMRDIAITVAHFTERE